MDTREYLDRLLQLADQRVYELQKHLKRYRAGGPRLTTG